MIDFIKIISPIGTEKTINLKPHWDKTKVYIPFLIMGFYYLNKKTGITTNEPKAWELQHGILEEKIYAHTWYFYPCIYTNELRVNDGDDSYLKTNISWEDKELISLLAAEIYESIKELIETIRAFGYECDGD